MPVLINLSGVIEDEWIEFDGSKSTTEAGQVIVSLKRLQDDWENLEQASFSLGVELEVTDGIDDIEAYLPRLELVVLNFGAFSDGRAFSQARLLRERFAFRGDLRARGEVVRDQLSFMQRCGFNQFSLADGESVELALGAFADISKSYQPGLEPPA